MARDLTFKLILDSLGFQRGAKAAGDALSKLGKDVKQVSGDLGPLGGGLDWLGTLAAKLSSPVGMATVAVGALGAGALAAAKGVAALSEEAEKLQNAATKTGLSLQAVQQFQRTAVNLGFSLESVTGAINKMQRSLEQTPGRFAKVGLELSKIRGLAPEAQFTEIARQIAAMDTPSQRAAAAMVTFGRAGAELLPVLMKIGKDGGDSIVSMSDEQIGSLLKVDDALDNAAGAWKDLENQFFATLAQSPAVVRAIEDLAEAISLVASNIKDNQAAWQLYAALFTKGIGLGGANSPAGLLRGVGVMLGKPPKAQSQWGAVAPEIELSDPMKAWAEMDRAAPAINRLAKEQEAAAKAAREHATQLRTLNFELSGQSWYAEQAMNSLNLYFNGVGGIADVVPLTTDEIDAFNKSLGEIPEMGFSLVDTQVVKVKQNTIDWAQELQNAANIMLAMGDTLGNVGQSLAGIMAGMAGMKEGWGTFSKGMDKGGFSGAMGMLSGGLGMLSSAIGIGKAIVNLFKGDPVKKAQKEAGAALGFGISKEMAEQFAKTAKEQGKSIAQVAKEWLAGMKSELRATGMGQMAEGVDSMLQLLGTSPEITRIAAGNFATLFWETVKDKGWVAASAAFKDTFGKLKEFFGENMPASLTGISGLMNLAANPAVAPYLQAAQAQGQFVTGAMNAGIMTTGMQGDSVTIARQTLANLKENGATDEQGYQAIGGLLQANVNAAIASGQGISTELQALLDEAKAQDVEIVAGIAEQQLDVLRAIYKQLGGTGTSATGNTGTESSSNGKVPEYASGGIINAGRGRLAMLHGREAIIPMNKMGGGGSGVNVYIRQEPWQTLPDYRAFSQLINREVRKALRSDPGTRHDARVAVNGGR